MFNSIPSVKLKLTLILLPISCLLINDIAQHALTAVIHERGQQLWIKDLFWLVDVLSFTILPLGLLLFYSKKGYLKWQDLDIRVEKLLLNSVLAVTLAVFLWFIFMLKFAWLTDYLNQLLPSTASINRFFYMPEDGLIRYLFLSVYIAFSAGIVEEVLFRSYLIRSLESCGCRTLSACTISVFLIVLVHIGSGASYMLNPLIAGIVFTAFYVKTRNIAPLILAHVLLDLSYATGLDNSLARLIVPILTGD